MIPIAKPYIGPEEQAAVAEVLASGILAAGPRVRAFERAFADLCHVQGAAACASGTAGLCVAMAALDLPPGSHVLTTPFSFIATANSILYAGYQPVFADVDPGTYMLTAEGVRTAFARDPAIKAILPVHLYGQPAEIREIVDIARAHDAYVVEDCAQAHGATEDGQPVGGIGDLGVFSFYPTKNMMTGEGGMITGRNEALLERCRLIINQGSPVRYQHTVLGFNYRMTSIAAAIGLCQLERLPAWNEARRRHAAALTAGFADLPGVRTPVERAAVVHVYHQYVIRTAERDALRTSLREAGIESEVYYPCTIPDQPLYQSLGIARGEIPVAQQLTRDVLALPVHPAVTDQEIATIIQAVRSYAPTRAPVTSS